MPSMTLSRRAFCLWAAVFAVSGVHAEVLNPGRFKPFVDANRVDMEIAHVLNVLGSYPPGSWSRAASDFAFAQLGNGSLVGIARAGTALAKIGPQLLPRFPQAFPALGANVANILSGAYSGYTQPLPGSGLAAYILVKDSAVLGGTQPGPGREELALTLVHELNHVRNRVQLGFLHTDPTPTPARFVDPLLAGALDGTTSMADYVAELGAAHTSWRCLQEWNNRWRGIPIRTTVPPAALYQFALEQAEHERVRGKYLTALATRPSLPGMPDAMNQQAAIWMRLVRGLTFVDDVAENIKAANLFDAAASGAAATGFRRPVDRPDGALNYWSVVR